MIGPIELKAKVHFYVGDKLASATVGLAPGKVPTQEDLLRAIGQALLGAQQQFGEANIDLIDGETFFNCVLVPGLTGRRGKFALPKQFAYDLAATEAAALAAASKEGE